MSVFPLLVAALLASGLKPIEKPQTTPQETVSEASPRAETTPAAEHADAPPAPRLVREPLSGDRREFAFPEDGRRDAPDYDGRPDAKPTPGQRALWIPRVLLAPFYAVNEYVVRRPLRAVTLLAEENNVGSKIANVFTLGTGGRVGLLPTALFDFGVRSSIGLYFFGQDVPTEGDRFGLHLAYGGDEWWRASVTERIQLNPDHGAGHTPSLLNFGFEFDQRPDHLASGTGVGEFQRVGTFKWTRIEGRVGTELHFGALDTIELRVSASRNRFGDGEDDIDKADDALFALFGDDVDRATVEAAFPGFDGYELVTGGVSLNLDSRDADPGHPGSGVRWRGDLDLATDAGNTARTWATWGTELGLYADLNSRRRVLSLNHRVQMSETLGDAAIPFTELPLLGGVQGLRGFVEGRIRGSSTWLSTLQYTYPIWAYFDGFAFYEVGNAYDGRFEDFSVASMASSFGVGIQSNASRDAAFALLVAAGTTPFDAQSYAVDSVRLVIGTQRGF